MKSLAQQVREFREHPSRNWTVSHMAKKVGTSRQNLENIERGAVLHPRCIADLARVMNTPVEQLLGRPAPAIPLRAAEELARYPSTAAQASPADALRTLCSALAAVPEEVIPSLATNMAELVRTRGAQHMQEVVLMLLQRPSGKQRRAGG